MKIPQIRTDIHAYRLQIRAKWNRFYQLQRTKNSTLNICLLFKIMRFTPITLTAQHICPIKTQAFNLLILDFVQIDSSMNTYLVHTAKHYKLSKLHLCGQNLHPCVSWDEVSRRIAQSVWILQLQHHVSRSWSQNRNFFKADTTSTFDGFK